MTRKPNRFRAPTLAALMVALAASPTLSPADEADAPTAPAVARPNILFILPDDHSHRGVGCYPQAPEWVETPHIDRLAAEGVRFAPSYIGAWCMSSRATLLTGLHQTGVQTMRSQGKYPGSTYDPQQCPFWPRVFRQHGYATAHIGKWHTGDDTGYGRDWDYQIVWNRPGLPENAHDYYHDQQISFHGSEPRLVEGYSTDNYTRWAVEYIRQAGQQRDKPWYLWLCYGAPHAPYVPAERHRDAFPDATVPTPADIYPPRPGKPAYAQAVNVWQPGPQGEPIAPLQRAYFETNPARSLSEWVRQYQQCVLAVDEGVAQLLQSLEETGQRHSTLIVFTSDQGFAWGQHGFQDKHGPYDANIASPLIFNMPGKIAEGAVCDVAVAGVDLIPTFFRFAGIDLPWEMHGHDLSPLLADPLSAWPHPAFMPYTVSTFGDATSRVPPPKPKREKVPWYVLLRQGRYKYIRTLEVGEIEELYDLVDDPEELVNLAMESSHRQRLIEFRQAALDELRRTNAKLVDHLPSVAER